MGFWEQYRDWLIIALLGVVAIAFARWVFSGGLRQSRKKARSTATDDPDLNITVRNLTAELGSTGDDIQIVRHDSEGGSADLTDGDLQREVDGVLRKRGSIS
ncbi:MAG: hypothetical protein Q8Q05_00210 [bacterium]|nr:hypothetical protein [bacterium]